MPSEQCSPPALIVEVDEQDRERQMRASGEELSCSGTNADGMEPGEHHRSGARTVYQ